MSDQAQQTDIALPGPSGHYLFGNASEYYANRLRFLDRMIATYGDLVRYRIGCDWTYLINDPRLVRDALRDWSHLDNATNDTGFALDDSFVAKQGKSRVQPRSIVHSTMCPREVTGFHAEMVIAVDDALAAWRDGQERDVLADMMRLNIEMISRTLFGRPAAAWLEPVLPVLTDLQRLSGAFTTSEVTRERMNVSQRRAMFIETESLVERFVAELLDGSGPRAPVVDILFRARDGGKLTQRQAVHEICVLLLSTSSTAVAAAWVLHCLSQQDEARANLDRELDALPAGPIAREDLAGLTAVSTFINEALRLFPPLGLLHRTVNSDWSLGPLHMRARDRVHISPYHLHRHSAFWHRPDDFCPERFEPGSPWHRHEQQLAYFPFGFGIRRCIGEGMAWHQLQVILATVARRHRMEAMHVPTYDVSPVGVLHPDALALPMRIRLRSPASAQALLKAGS